MATLKAFGGNNILNMTLRKFYQQNPTRFNGSGTSGGFTYSFATSAAPTIALGNTGPGPAHNMVISFSNIGMNIAAQSGSGPNLNRNVPMKVFGILGISSGVFSITSLTFQIENATGIDTLIQGVINNQVAPKLERSLSGITLPQLNKIFGTNLSAEVRTGTIITGPAIEIGARISGSTSTANADAPTAANINALNNGSATNALIIGMVASDAVNTLIKALISPLSYSFNETRSGPLGTAAGIKGTIKATTPVLSISNSSGKAATRVSISNLQAGIKDPFTGWHWVSIPFPSVDVTVNNSLSAQSNKGIITLTGVGSLSVSLNWPSLLQPVESIVKSLLNGVLSLFKGTISSAVQGKTFEIFKLPSNLPGTNLGATVSFDANGLSYFGGSVRAMVRVSN